MKPESRWTSTPPSESGWYWWRDAEGTTEVVAYICASARQAYFLAEEEDIDNLGGLWQGPLEPLE